MKKYKTRSLELVVRPDNIIEVSVPEEWDQPDTVETATENALLLQKVTSDEKYATLVLMPSIHMNKEVINVYNQIKSAQVADALLVKSFGARVLGNLALKVVRLDRPMRLFTDRSKAELWLLNTIAKQRQKQVVY